MFSIKQLAIGLLSFQSVFAASTPDVETLEKNAEANPQTPSLEVLISTAFPNSEVFGVKLVNGYATEAAISITNNEPEPVTLELVGGSLWSRPLMEGGDSQPLRNLTSVVYKAEILPGLSETIPYKISTEMHPVDAILKLMAVIADSKGSYYTISAYNEAVTIVEAPTSIFDPQIIFLYLVLAGGFAGTVYFVYKTWVTTLFPKQPKRRTEKSKKVEPAPVSPGEIPTTASATGSKGYDESWIPAAHLSRPQAKRIRSGTPSGTKTKKAV